MKLALSNSLATPGVGVFNPSQIANLSLGLSTVVGNIWQGTQASPGSPSVTKGVHPVGYTPAMWGTSIYAEQTTAADKCSVGNNDVLPRGTYSQASNDELDLSSSVSLTGNFTTYSVGQVGNTSNGCAPLGSSGDSTFIGFFPGVGSLLALPGTVIVCNAGTPTTGLVLFRAHRTGVDCRLDVTGGSATGTDPADPSQSAFTFTHISSAQGAGTSTGDQNDIRLNLVIARYIAKDSAEDLQIRDWITSNYGASL